MRYKRIDKEGVFDDRIFESDDDVIEYANEVIAEDSEETSFIDNINEALEYLSCINFKIIEIKGR